MNAARPQAAPSAGTRTTSRQDAKDAKKTQTKSAPPLASWRDTWLCCLLAFRGPVEKCFCFRPRQLLTCDLRVLRGLRSGMRAADGTDARATAVAWTPSTVFLSRPSSRQDAKHAKKKMRTEDRGRRARSGTKPRAPTRRPEFPCFPAGRRPPSNAESSATALEAERCRWTLGRGDKIAWMWMGAREADHR